jgi:DNA-binding XRE family transcriptional regulator
MAAVIFNARSTNGRFYPSTAAFGKLKSVCRWLTNPLTGSCATAYKGRITTTAKGSHPDKLRNPVKRGTVGAVPRRTPKDSANWPLTLKTWRKRSKRTQQSAADWIGVPLRTYQDWEYGNRKPTLIPPDKCREIVA